MFFKKYKHALTNHSWAMPLIAVFVTALTKIACYFKQIEINIMWCVFIGVLAALIYPLLRIEDSDKNHRKK